METQGMADNHTAAVAVYILSVPRTEKHQIYAEKGKPNFPLFLQKDLQSELHSHI